MSVCKITLNIFTTLLVIFKQAECGLVRRFNYDARLYEHFDLESRSIQYSRTDPDDWKNISTLTDAKNFTFSSMICTLGPGAWFFYPDPDYGMGNDQTYYLVVGEHCVRADDIESIQPLGKMDELLDQGILLFEKPHFGSQQTLVAADSGSGGGGSLIFTGGASFMVEGGGQKICLRPGLTVFEEGYCLIPNLKAAFGIEGTVNIKENCTDGEDKEGSDEKTLIVQNCYTDGVHEIITDQDLTIDKLNEVCSGGGDEFLKAKFTILMDMWSLRLGQKLNTMPEATKPENKIKLEILWQTLEIFKGSCTIVDDIYIYLLGHLLAMHLKNMWDADGYNATSTTTGEWNVTKTVFEFCTEHMKEINTIEGESCDSGKGKNKTKREVDPEDGFTEEDDSWFEIVNGQDFDPVIEQMWLLFNFVLPSCNLVAGYINNDWSDLVVLFHENYLDPLQDIWAETEDWPRIYSAVFHGYDMKDVHRDIVTCVKAALMASPSYDPIGRPKSLREKMSYLHETPKFGKVDQPKLPRTKRLDEENLV